MGGDAPPEHPMTITTATRLRHPHLTAVLVDGLIVGVGERDSDLCERAADEMRGLSQAQLEAFGPGSDPAEYDFAGAAW